MAHRDRAAVTCAVFLAGGLWLTTNAQEPASTIGARALVSDLTASAIDRGPRDADAPRLARTALDAMPDRASAAFLPGSVVVRFRDGTSPERARALLTLVGGSSTSSPDGADFSIVAVGASADPEAAARRLEQQPDVEYAQARYRVWASFVPNDPLYARQWNFPALDMERAWDLNRGASPSITVAVLDSGVAYRAALLRFNAVAWQAGAGAPRFPALGTVDVPFAAAPEMGGPDRFVAPRDFIWNDTVPLDLDGHGTHVAGTIGQLTNNGIGVAGMAFNVRIMPVKVLDGFWDGIFNSPVVATDDVVARGIRYAVDNGAKIINLSLGRSGGPEAPVVQAAVVYAVSHGAFVVAAAGNEFLDGNPPQRVSGFATQIDGMVAVGAIGPDRRRAYYSSTGPFVELVAPGGNSRVGGASAEILQQTFDLGLVETYLDGAARLSLLRYGAPRFDAFSYQAFEGTSMAAPHVAGFAALLMQQGITDPAAIEAAMKQYATDLGPAGRDDEYGAGLINPRATLRGMGLLR